MIRGQNEDLIDGWLRAKGHRAADRAGGARLYRGAARRRAHRPRRLRAAPPDRALAKQLSLVTVTPPFDPGIDEQFLFYPTRAQMDPGSIWLRNLMLGIGREMDQRERKAA